jgi:Caspase domain
VGESSGPGQGWSGRRFLVTMAVDRYRYLDEADPLARPVRDAERVAGLLRPHGYEHALGIGNYWGAQQVRESLSHWSKDTGFGENDVLVFYFAGHGLVEDRDRHYLMCWDSSEDDPAATALATEDVVRILTRHGLRSLLLVLDTCYAGAGAADGARVVLRGIARRVGGGASSGVWFLASARAKDEAGDGAFVDALLETVGEVGERTGQRQRFLDLTDVVAAVNRRFDLMHLRQRAELAAGMVTGLAPFLPNQGYRQHLPREDTNLELQRRFAARELHDHFGPRSRGG